MLKYIAYHDVQFLLVALLFMMLYSAAMAVHMRRRTLVAVVAIASIFAFGYQSMRASHAVLGRPAWVPGEITGFLRGYEKFSMNGKDWLAVLITTDSGPRLIAVPYTPKEAQQLEKGMQDMVKLGQAQVVRKRGDGTEVGSGAPGTGGDNPQEGGTLEFYQFNQDFLEPKIDQ